jgi:hypothetical protein
VHKHAKDELRNMRRNIHTEKWKAEEEHMNVNRKERIIRVRITGRRVIR